LTDINEKVSLDFSSLGSENGAYGVYRDVFKFHEATDSPIWPLGQAVFPSQERIDLRVKLVDEEVNKELFEAIKNRDMVEVADAIADSIYVLVGMALEFGIPLVDVWEEVQRSNMAKVDPTTGKVRRREDGKILKPDGWTPPDIASLVETIPNDDERPAVSHEDTISRARSKIED
jgi:predicted HAD superfamily Cof-like phosphohydrolase